MKHEVYSCLKMLESLREKIVSTFDIEGWDSVEDLGEEYKRISKLLEKYLNDEEIKFIPKIGFESKRYH